MSNDIYSDTTYKYIEFIHTFDLLDKEEEIALAKRIKLGDPDAVEEFVNANLRLVAFMAREFAIKSGSEFDDLIAEGNIELVNCVKKFDPEKGPFGKFAAVFIRCRLNIYVASDKTIFVNPNRVYQARRLDKLTKQLTEQLRREPTTKELAEKMNLTVKQIGNLQCSKVSMVYINSGTNNALRMEDPYCPRPSIDIMKRELQDSVIRLLETLPDREYDIMCRRFGIGCQAQTLRQISKDIKPYLTFQRVDQIIQETLIQLKKELKCEKHIH